MSCLGTTATGRPCRKKLVDGEPRCLIHHTEYVTRELNMTTSQYRQWRRQQLQAQRDEHTQTNCSFINMDGSWCLAARSSPDENLCHQHYAAAYTARVAAEAARAANEAANDQRMQRLTQEALENERFYTFMNDALPGLERFIRSQISSALNIDCE